jgi:uncharacterized membrane protein YhiD involved in acid resistance
VWCSCAVGVFSGFGMILWAGAVTARVVLANVALHYIELRNWWSGSVAVDAL